MDFGLGIPGNWHRASQTDTPRHKPRRPGHRGRGNGHPGPGQGTVSAGPAASWGPTGKLW